MPKRPNKKKGQKKTSVETVPEYASDDERLYGNMDEPDPEAREYMYDDVDEFHASREKVLLDKGYKDDDTYHAAVSDEEEVLDLESEASDDDEIRDLKAQLRRVKSLQRKDELGSDVEEETDEEEGLPDRKSWGAKRSKYYGDNNIGAPGVAADADDEEEAELEEKEALRLQRQMAEQLDDQDFGLDIFQAPVEPRSAGGKEERIVKDLSKLSKKEKLKLLKKESPELMTLIDDLKLKMKELQDRLCPLKDLVARQQFTGKAADYVHTKFKLVLNYCMNIVFYLMLKSKQTAVHNHPVVKRLLQYRNILKQLEPLDEQMNAEVDDIVARLRAGKEVTLNSAQSQTTGGSFVRRKTGKVTKATDKKRTKLSELVSDSGSADSGSEDSDEMYEDLTGKAGKNKEKGNQYETKDERAALEYYQMMKAGRPGEDTPEEELEQDVEEQTEQVDMEMEEGDGKRAINFQIEKNRGLTAHKKKELRNPRVKHRMKYRRAQIRRKGQFRAPRTEMQKYGGEASGIRAAVKRGIKLK
ncbi:something about silencing protein 10-like [Dreissena polymorpha]|uniref:Sas10 C-terminal domain-containing protein n=1 Tax=Dreissena polymorpha TaxID=45954 RepID=A0A9D4CXT5_DREPO|nr:something about silencing protein 10-like [Dreissena polymorpha]KAH3733833.1 hypothetical protein DPMN_040270 [Dreissena polymorpha]